MCVCRVVWCTHNICSSNICFSILNVPSAHLSLTAEKACTDPLCHTRARPPHPPSVPHGATAEWWVGLQPNTEVLNQPPSPPLPSLLAMSAPHLYFTKKVGVQLFNVYCHLLTFDAAGEDEGCHFPPLSSPPLPFTSPPHPAVPALYWE